MLGCKELLRAYSSNNISERERDELGPGGGVKWPLTQRPRRTLDSRYALPFRHARQRELRRSSALSLI